jgi:hypothetical protein
VAKVRLNVLISGASGRIGNDLALKQTRDGQTILCRKPTFSEHRVFSAAQKAHQARFQAAAAYAKSAAKREPIYAELAKKSRHTAYNVALADFMRPPEILEVDLAGYAGQAGGVVRVRAHDDVLVKEVQVKIVDAHQQVVEQGAASGEANKLWWVYVATANCSTANVMVVARAVDLPGHAVERAEAKG